MPGGTATSPIEQFVETHFDVRHRGSEEWDVLCPKHGDRNASMRINVVKGVFMCHGCHIHGGMTRLARLVGQTWRPGSQQEMSLAMLQAKLTTLRKGVDDRTVRILPESALLRYQLPTSYWEDTRGFTPETVAAFDLGYDPINDCVTIPVRNVHGELLGFTRRFLDFDPDLDLGNDSKYKDPKGFRKADNLFASWMAAADESPSLVIVEGPLDAIKVWQAGHAAVAQYGSYITPRQIRLLKQLGAIEIILFYDNDNGGRGAVEYAKGWERDETGARVYDPTHDLRKHFIVKRVSYRCSAKDPGEMSDRQIDLAIQEARLIR